MKNLSYNKEFIARLYKVNKGPNFCAAYFATLKREEIKRLKITSSEALLLDINNVKFPTVIRKLKTGSGGYMLGFTVPRKIGKTLKTKTDHKFILLSGALPKTNIKEKEGYISLQKIVPEKTIRNYPIYVFELNNKLMAWIYAGGNKPVILPKFIPLTKTNCDILEFAGAFLCEGFKARKAGKHRDRFSFSNASRTQIKWFLNVSEKLLGIKKEEWKAQILFPKADLNTVKKLTYYWSLTGLSKEKITIVKNETVSASHGVCILNIFNSTLAEVVYYLVKECKVLALTSREYAINFFRGLSRGDVGICRKSITFTTESEENAKFFKKLCRKIGITVSKVYRDKRSKKCWNVYITSYKNFRRLLKLRCISHDKRLSKLNTNLLISKGSRPFLYLKLINSGFNTAKKAAKASSLSPITTRAYFDKLTKKGYLKKRVIDKYGKLSFKLTGKGKNTLKFYLGLEQTITNII